MTNRFDGYATLGDYCKDQCKSSWHSCLCESECASEERENWSLIAEAASLRGQLAKSGCVAVERGRLERLIEAGRIYQLWLAERCGAYQGITQQCLSVVSDDDLDGIDED